MAATRSVSLPIPLLLMLLILPAVTPLLWSHRAEPTPVTLSTTIRETLTSTVTPSWASDLNASFYRLLEEYRNQNKTLQEISANYNSLLDEYRRLKDAHTSLLSEYEEIKRERDGLRVLYEELRREHLILQGELSQTRAALENLQRDYQSLRGEYNKLVDKYNELLNAYKRLESYRSSAGQARWYESEAGRRLETDWFQEILVVWRGWYMLKSGLRTALELNEFESADAVMFAEMVRRDLSYNEGLYRTMIHEWLGDHPVSSGEDLANEIARLFYSLDHRYAIPGRDEPNAGLPMFPIELLARGLGDCEDHAMLMAALYKAAGFRVRLVVVPGHAALMIYLKGRWRFLEATIHDESGMDLPSRFYSTVTVDLLEESFLRNYRGATYYFEEI